MNNRFGDSYTKIAAFKEHFQYKLPIRLSLTFSFNIRISLELN